MILKNDDFASLAKKIKDEKKTIIVYGAGMIGQIIIPYIIQEYDLSEVLNCFIDADNRKWGSKIGVCGKEYIINSPDYLQTINSNNILLITNSKFFSSIDYLDGIENLKRIEGYVVPIMQLQEQKKADHIIFEHKKAEAIIPKRIHYCWFGKGEIPEFLKKCIDSWRVYCPDYEIIEWNEENYDVNRHDYTREAYAHKKYGYVTDMARLDILYENGGLYFDTDVSIEKNIDDLLYQDAFIGVEKWGNVNTGGGCGFVAGHPMLKELITYREKIHFELEDGSLNTNTNGLYETRPFLERGFKPCNALQEINGVTVYPSYVNHPYDYMSCETTKNESTVSIHHFYGGWMDEEEHRNREKTQNKYASILKRIEERHK